MMEAQVSPDNPILFVLDPANHDIAVPTYVDGELIAESESCVSVGIQPNFEGKTSVEITTFLGGLEQQRLTKIYEGRIKAPGKRLVVVTAEFEEVVSANLDSDRPAFEIWVDEEKSPARVVIRLT